MIAVDASRFGYCGLAHTCVDAKPSMIESIPSGGALSKKVRFWRMLLW